MKLDIPQNKKIYLFISEKIDNPVKGLKVIKKILNKKKTNDFCLLILGNKNKETFKDINFEFRHIKQIHNNTLSLIDIYSASDLLLAPSILESFGIVAQEAACCNLPTVAFSQTGFEDTIKHKKNGYIAKNNDLNDFENGINWCLNPDNYDYISRNGRNWIEKNFNEKVISTQYIEFYKEILNNY